MPYSANDLKLASELYVPGMTSTYQNKEYVYAGMSQQYAITGSDEIQWTENSTLEMKPLGDESVRQDSENLDYEFVKGSAKGAYISSTFSDAKLARMRENPIPATMQEHKNALARWRAAGFRDAATANTNIQAYGSSSFADTALETSQKDIADGTASITLANIYSIGSLYARNHALGNGEVPVLSIGQEDLDVLRTIEDLKNKDYNLGAAPSITGTIGNQVGGLQLMVDQDLNWSGTIRTCFAFLPSAMASYVQQAPKIRFEEVQDKHYIPEAYMKTDEGWLRTRRKGVVQLNTLRNY